MSDIFQADPGTPANPGAVLSGVRTGAGAADACVVRRARGVGGARVGRGVGSGSAGTPVARRAVSAHHAMPRRRGRAAGRRARARAQRQGGRARLAPRPPRCHSTGTLELYT